MSILAFGVWGILAYKGGYRLLARFQGLPIGGHVLLDLMSLVIGISGSIAGMSALWALAMRALGRTPSSLIGAPDDNAIDVAYREAADERVLAGAARATARPPRAD